MANRGKTLQAALAAMMLLVGAWPARASDGLVLRAVGFFEAEASGTGTCEIPTIADGIPVSSDTVGLSSTFGFPTIQYPESICLGWMEVQNNMTVQGIDVTKVSIRLKIAGANQFRSFVPTRKGFPTACQQLRNYTVFTGAHLFPVGTPPEYGNTGSGAPHVAFVNLLPMVTAQVFNCLREQYGTLPPDVFASFPLVIRATAHGVADDGGKHKSNQIRFTLNLVRFCGNGRIDFGEQCDPNGPNACSVGPCDLQSATCANNDAVPCQTDADCGGTCLPQGDPMECSCLYGGNVYPN
jgi:hypothetical protein